MAKQTLAVSESLINKESVSTYTQDTGFSNTGVANSTPVNTVSDIKGAITPLPAAFGTASEKVAHKNVEMKPVMDQDMGDWKDVKDRKLLNKTN